ncbi:LuxR C-terminal-related transcriptional regulator [Streptomyces sp. NPDC052415]|uniref:LuxR C-terminal-related transcriptional regulator n=1 Tax=Streptomyces sp. NPDC052415 TaxID=3365690 RepID=UPI0037CE0826
MTWATRPHVRLQRIGTLMNSECTTPLLTPRQKQVAAFVVSGPTNPEIAKHLDVTADCVKKHLRAVRTQVGTGPRSSQPVLANAVLAAREVEPPKSSGPAPVFKDDERKLLLAVARYSAPEDIGRSAGLPSDEVLSAINALVRKAGPDCTGPTHLVGLAYRWGLLGCGPGARAGDATRDHRRVSRA